MLAQFIEMVNDIPGRVNRSLDGVCNWSLLWFYPEKILGVFNDVFEPAGYLAEDPIEEFKWCPDNSPD